MAPASPGAQAGGMDTIVLGMVEITRVVELPAKGRARDYVFPDVPVWLRSGTDRAVFAGDLLHSPLQISEPDDCPSFDEDEPRARDSRRRVVTSAAADRPIDSAPRVPSPREPHFVASPKKEAGAMRPGAGPVRVRARQCVRRVRWPDR